MAEKTYKINIDPHILELLGPSLYTNIYYVLAELIANAYDADASNVYIITHENDITVEDDGTGMSYINGDIDKYLNVANITRSIASDSLTPVKKRKKMGRKGIGKLAALSVSEDVLIKTISNNEKSGFVLSRQISKDNLLMPLDDEEIVFEKVFGSGTAVVMKNPQYKLHKTPSVVKKNLLKVFPLVDQDFRIHIINGNKEEIIDSFDKGIISELSTLITLGSDFESLSDYFKTPFDARLEDLLKNRESKKIMVNMYNKDGIEGTYTVEIKGWIGTYKTTRERKEVLTDFPDNFISLYANKKLGEFNILPIVGKNKLAEVYIVGQLHVDIFELTELPDMALSNRQGYKTDDPRYQTVINYVSTELLPDILNMRTLYALMNKEGEEKRKLKKQHKDEETFKESVEIFKNNTAKNAAQNVASRLNIDLKEAQEIEEIFSDEINTNSSTLGIKSLVDSQKKKILISHTSEDKDLADVIYDMLLFNNVPPEDIIYTHANNEASRIPEGDVGESGVYDYLREFFVDSYSTEKIYVIFVTSNEMRESWGALVEVGAAWITQMEHKIFNIGDFRPEYPLDDRQQWHTSYRDSDKKLYMSGIDADIFSQKIEYICDKLGYTKKSREENYSHLNTLVKISDK